MNFQFPLPIYTTTLNFNKAICCLGFSLHIENFTSNPTKDFPSYQTPKTSCCFCCCWRWRMSPLKLINGWRFG
ncbi:hypothetical protein HanRHA438_Chr01g0013351 [Helianthus annuus]|nr:hypothetical protein HanRHA438_Chr01g0013351 [Helianthus annuus]